MGPGHSPYPLPYPGVTVRYVDRWAPAANAELFPELGEEAAFPPPDIIADLDIERLKALSDEGVDFVVASHLLEHLADPMGLLADVHRVLRRGGVVLILLPDRHVTFDRLRRPTDLAHLIAEHEAGVTEVDDAHIEEFIKATAPIGTLSDDPAERQRHIQAHRKRSVHAHCWDLEEFEEVLNYSIQSLGMQWEFVDALLTEEGGPDSIEFGFVLRKSIADCPPQLMAVRFELAWTAWQAEHQEALRRLSDIAEREAQNDRTLVQLAECRAELSALKNTKTFRFSESGRRAYGRLLR